MTSAAMRDSRTGIRRGADVAEGPEVSRCATACGSGRVLAFVVGNFLAAGIAWAQPAAAPVAPAGQPLRTEIDNLESFDPEAARDADRAKRLLRSLLAEDMARAAAAPGLAGATPAPSAAPAPPTAVQGIAPAAKAQEPVKSVSIGVADVGTAPGQAHVPGASGATPGRDHGDPRGAHASPGNAAHDSRSGDGAASASRGAGDDAAATSSVPVDGARTRALIADLLSEILPYMIGAILLYIGALVLKARLARGPRSDGRRRRKRRNGRSGGQAASSRAAGPPAGAANIGAEAQAELAGR